MQNSPINIQEYKISKQIVLTMNLSNLILLKYSIETLLKQKSRYCNPTNSFRVQLWFESN